VEVEAELAQTIVNQYFYLYILKKSWT